MKSAKFGRFAGFFSAIVLSLPCLAQSAIDVFLNQRADHSFREPYRGIVRAGDNMEEPILKVIAGARRSLDMAIHGLDLPNIGLALADAHRRGVRVRVILENSNSTPRTILTRKEIESLNPYAQVFYESFVRLLDSNGDGVLTPAEAEMRDPLRIIRAAGIPWIDDREDGTEGSGLMHHKFVVADEDVVLISSGNFTHSCLFGDFDSFRTRGNPNGLVVLRNRHVAEPFLQEFALMWGDGPGGRRDSLFGLAKPLRVPQTFSVGNERLTVQFSPVSPKLDFSFSVNGLIQRNLLAARHSVDIAQFVFSEQRLTDALRNRWNVGVAVRGVFEPLFAAQYYSETLDLWGMARPTKSCLSERGNGPWQGRLPLVGVARLPRGDLLHHKFAVVDGLRLLFGSHNWSFSANHINDETLVVLDSPVVAGVFADEFARLLREARLGPPAGLPEKATLEWDACANAPVQLDPVDPVEPSVWPYG